MTSETRKPEREPEGQSYWNLHAKNYGRSLRLLGRPIPRMLELTAEATRGAARVWR